MRLRNLISCAVLVAAAALLGSCVSTQHQPIPVPTISRPTLFEVRRGPQKQQLVAAVWTPNGQYGQVVYNPAGPLWPIQPTDHWVDTGLESPPSGNLCADYVQELGAECVVGDWEGDPNQVQNPVPCGPY